MPHGKRAPDAARHGGVEEEPADRPEPAQESEADEHGGLMRARTTFVTSVDREQARDDARHGVAEREARVAGVEHVEQLDLHRGERRQRAAEAGAEQRPAVRGQRQALLEAS